jgi:hypothetical protein
MHTYSIDQIIGWLRDGLWWFVLSTIGLARFAVVPSQPPAWWYRWWSYQDWYGGSDDDWHPGRELAERYILGAWRLLGEWVDESAEKFASSALTLARALIGTLPGWAGTVARGLVALLDRIGEGVLIWASNAIQAAQRLYDWLPLEIKVAGMSWATLFEFVKNSVKSWVQTTYAQFVSDARTAIEWARNQGTFLVTWYNSVGNWLTAFKLSPKSLIDSLYGSGLAAAIHLATDAGPWLYSLWAIYHAEVSAFVADPGAWIKARLEAELNRIW